MFKPIFYSTKFWLIFLSLIFALIFVFSTPFYVKYKARHKVFTKVVNLEPKEFAIVLGAGIKRNGQPGSYLKKRLDDAIKLYNNRKIKKILISGDNGQSNYDEISIMNRYLVDRGVPQHIIYGDYAGFDTYSSMERADKLFNIKNAVIVSQAYHLPRAIYIAREKGIDALGFAQHYDYGRKRYYKREYLATVKSFFDCLRNRKAKFYGKKIDTSKGSNIKL